MKLCLIFYQLSLLRLSMTHSYSSRSRMLVVLWLLVVNMSLLVQACCCCCTVSSGFGSLDLFPFPDDGLSVLEA